MKRSSCLSALLVGLSLTTALLVEGTALAAPANTNTTDKQPVKQVAQANPTAQPSDQPSQPTAPPTTGEESTTPPTQPAVTLGTTTPPPASDTPAAAAPEEPKKPKPRPFAGSAIFFQQSMTTNTVFRGQTQYANPTAEGSIWMLPRYAINSSFQLRGRFIVSYEQTNSETTQYRNEPMLSDLTLQLFYRKIPKFLGIQPAIAANIGLPTSKLSRARTMAVAPGASLQLVRGFEHVLGGDLTIIASGIYTHPLYQSKNPEVIDPRPAGAFQCVGGNGCNDLLSGTMNPSDVLSYILIISQEWGKWNPAIFYLGASQWAYTPKDVANPVDGTPVGRPEGFQPTSVRQTHYLSAWLDYNFNSWITGEVGYWNSISGLNGAGQRANLIFDRYQDTRVYLGASIQIDNLVKELQGGDQGDGGIVRAKAQKIPFFTF